MVSDCWFEVLPPKRYTGNKPPNTKQWPLSTMPVASQSCSNFAIFTFSYFHPFTSKPLFKFQQWKNRFFSKNGLLLLCVCVVFFLSGAVLSSVDMHNNGRNHTMPPKIIMNS